ncbi:permease [Variovorax sp. J22G47]|uniref:AI-2E family transporter n=1 Tax=Variovorax fucosicus TaxID=3053517 RepID=UPI0025755142|nr:permease [Variovorax sp. J22G47]MDM0058425.1 permease [Variovorax sp. J22G47]
MRPPPGRPKASRTPSSGGGEAYEAASLGPGVFPPASRHVVIASYLLIAGALLLVLWRDLLPGLLFVCLGFLGTRRLARLFDGALPTRFQGAGSSWPRAIAAALVMLAPIGLLVLAFAEAREFVLNAPEQYQELLDYIARTILELRLKLPAEVAVYLPEGSAEVQRMIATYLRAQAGALALTGRAWLGGLLFAYVGLIVGALAGVARASALQGPLALELQQRVRLFGEAFRQIVAAQFWIAAFNTLLTAAFLLVLLPLWGLRLPYEPALITLTFVAGLVPIVGNLLCNAVLTLVGLSVSPIAAAACLIFLIVIHKAEYVINAKVVGSRTHMAVWELLAVMFVAEAVFGPAGLVAAPLFYAYLKKELQAKRLV